MEKIWYRNNLLGLLIIIISITTSGYTLTLVDNVMFHGILIVPIFWLLFYGKKKLEFNSLIFFGMLLFSILSLIINYNKTFLLYNLRFILIFSFSYFVSVNLKFKKFCQVYILVVYIISIISLIAYFLVNTFRIIPQLPVIQTPQNVQYYNGILFFINTQSFMHFRNFGAFWEPGIFASHILIAMLLELIFMKNPRYFVLFILSLTLYTTKSTAGYILYGLIVLLALNRLTNPKNQVLISLFAVPIIIIGFIMQNEIIDFLGRIQPTIFSELLYENQSQSLIHRLNSPVNNLLVFFKKPFLGASLGGADLIYSSLGNISQTSTTTYFFSAIGLGGIFYSLLLVKGTLFNKKISFINRIILFVMIFLIINKEPHIFFSITYILMFSLLKFGGKNEERSKYLIY